MTKTIETEAIFPLEGSIGYQIRTTHRLFQRYLQSKIEPHGVTIGMWYFLRVLWQKDGMTQRELSQLAGTMEPTTLTALRAMEKSGLISRKRHAKDGRKMNVFLTNKGRSLQKILLPLAKAVVQDACEKMEASETERFLKSLGSIQLSLAEKLQDVPLEPNRKLS